MRDNKLHVSALQPEKETPWEVSANGNYFSISFAHSCLRIQIPNMYEVKFKKPVERERCRPPKKIGVTFLVFSFTHDCMRFRQNHSENYEPKLFKELSANVINQWNSVSQIAKKIYNNKRRLTATHRSPVK